MTLINGHIIELDDSDYALLNNIDNISEYNRILYMLQDKKYLELIHNEEQGYIPPFFNV